MRTLIYTVDTHTSDPDGRKMLFAPIQKNAKRFFRNGTITASPFFI